MEFVAPWTREGLWRNSRAAIYRYSQWEFGLKSDNIPYRYTQQKGKEITIKKCSIPVISNSSISESG